MALDFGEMITSYTCTSLKHLKVAEITQFHSTPKINLILQFLQLSGNLKSETQYGLKNSA